MRRHRDLPHTPRTRTRPPPSMGDDQAEAFTDALCESASIDTSAAAADAEEGNAAIAAFAMASEAAVKAASGRGRGQKWICRR